MSLPVILSIFTSVMFGCLAVYFSIREDKSKKVLLLRDMSSKQHLYEIAILKEIQDRIGYSFDVEKVIDVLTGSLRSLIPFSTASSLLVADDRIICKTYLEEAVSEGFLRQVNKSMLDSLDILVGHPQKRMKESVSGMVIDNNNHKPLASYFHIPLVVNQQIVGMITIASSKPNVYKKEEILTLYRISNQATSALGRLQNVLNIEKEKLMAMIASLVDGVFMVDMNSQLLVTNQAAKHYLNIDKENPTIIDILTAMPSTYNFGVKIQQAIIENRTVVQKDVQINDKFFEIYITPVLKPQGMRSSKFEVPLGNVIGASILIHDVTIEKSAERMKEDFTNIIVHELRSPVTAIKAASQFIVSSEEKLNSEDRRKMLVLINSQAQKLLDEIALILDAAKLEAGMFTLQKVESDISKLVDEKVTFFRPEAETKHIELDSQIQNEMPHVFIDPIHISQVVNNLLSNSLKFTPVGGKIVISAKTENDKIIVSVSDNGAGIPRDKQPILFKKFSQIQTPNAHVGTGLGLYITKGIVEAHGGSISLDSEVGIGTTISFTIPLKRIENISTLPVPRITPN